MISQLFHGSDHIIKNPQFGFGKATNDYGRGFYCTEDKELAKEWSVTEGIDGYVNCYTIDDTSLNIIRLDTEDYSCLHWIGLLISNRIFDLNQPISIMAAEYLHQNFRVDISEADVIIGYRADDSYFSYARDFLNNTICVEQLERALKLGDLGKQYVLRSEKAFNALSFYKTESVQSDIWYPRKNSRDKRARRDYFDMGAENYLNGLYINQIIREGVKENDPRLQ